MNTTLRGVLSKQVGNWSIVLTVITEVSRTCAGICQGGGRP
ncbi:hypothetical protein [Arthrobacter sp. TB 23]|nr:hypothetical protein [Arthrobacter sp. TB 23]